MRSIMTKQPACLYIERDQSACCDAPNREAKCSCTIVVALYCFAHRVENEARARGREEEGELRTDETSRETVGELAAPPAEGAT